MHCLQIIVRERCRHTVKIYDEQSMGNRKKCIQAGVHLSEDMNESIVNDL